MELESVCVKNSHSCHLSPFSRILETTNASQPNFRPCNPMLKWFFKDVRFRFLSNLYKFFFFNEKNSVKLELALVRTSSPFHYASLFKIVLRLAMFHSGIFSLEILKYSSHVFKWLLFEPCFKSLHVRFPGNIYFNDVYSAWIGDSHPNHFLHVRLACSSNVPLSSFRSRNPKLSLMVL